MAQAPKKNDSSKSDKSGKGVRPSDYDFTEIKDSVKKDFDPPSDQTKSSKLKQTNKSDKRYGLDDLDAINQQIPYFRSFITVRQATMLDNANGKGLLSNIRGIVGFMRSKEMDLEEIAGLRKAVGSLKKTKIENYVPSAASTDIPQIEQKTKRQLLEEKRETITQKAKESKVDKSTIGMRIEIERLKRKYPSDKNLIVLSAILTSKDGCLIHRTTEERVRSLHAALQESGSVILNDYLTTFSIDTLFDIYFLYLAALKKMLFEQFKKISANGSGFSPNAIESARRDLRVINILLEQKNLKKTISNVSKKLNGFKYAFHPLVPLDVAKTYDAKPGEDNKKIGPGTVKLNKFLIRIYLSVFAQIPIFQPLAKKLCDALPTDHTCKVMIANVTMDNAYMQFKISKTSKDRTISQQALSIYNYGKRFIDSSIKDNPSTASEGRILVRTAEMAEESAFLNENIEPEVIQFGYRAATLALPYFKGEAKGIIRRMFEIAEARKIELT